MTERNIPPQELKSYEDSVNAYRDIVNNKRIAKNTIMLYMRVMVLMLIGLYTSRVILQSLGVENYGINNVIAGFMSVPGVMTR